MHIYIYIYIYLYIYIYASVNLAMTSSHNGLSLADFFFVNWTLRNKLNLNLNSNAHFFSVKEIYLKMACAKRHPFCAGLNMWSGIFREWCWMSKYFSIDAPAPASFLTPHWRTRLTKQLQQHWGWEQSYVLFLGLNINRSRNPTGWTDYNDMWYNRCTFMISICNPYIHSLLYFLR